MAVEQEIRIQKTLEKRLTKAKLRQITEKLGQELVDMQRERSASGFDNQDTRFKRYTKQYERFKKRFVSGDIRKNKTMKKLLRKARKPYKAQSFRDTMQLTGQLFRDMKFETIEPKGGFFSKKITLGVRLYIDKSSEEKAKGLFSNGYKFFGFPKFGAKAKKRLEKVFNI